MNGPGGVPPELGAFGAGAICLGAVALIVVIWVIATVNRFVRLRNTMRECWAGIDVQLKRRYDLIPNLVATAKGYAAHEKELLEELVRLRERAEANHGSAASQAEDENHLVHAMNRFLARAEAYPDLKASAAFLELQKELSNTEDRIAAARRFYNANVREYNTLLETFPTGAIGRSNGHTLADYFEIDTLSVREVPKVG